MATYFSVHTEYTRNDGSHGACSCARNTLPEALADGVRDGTYYLLVCEYPTVQTTVEELCSACNGDGEVVTRRPRSLKRKRCPECKGHKGPLSTIGPVPVQIHDNAKDALNELRNASAVPA